MKISQDQFDDIQLHGRDLFCQSLCQELRSDVFEVVSGRSEQELLGSVVAAYDKARAYGVNTVCGMKKFVRMAVYIDPNFDEVPVVKNFLQTVELNPDAKISILSELTAHQMRTIVK